MSEANGASNRELVVALSVLAGQARMARFPRKSVAPVPRSEWRPRSDGKAFDLTRRTEFIVLSPAVEVMERLDGWRAARDALLADPHIGPAMDKSSGVRGRHRLLDSRWLLTVGALSAQDFAANQAADLEAAAEWVVCRWYRDHGPSVEDTAITVLSGLSVSAPVPLGHGVELRQLTDDEIVALLSAGLMPGHVFEGSAFIDDRVSLCVSQVLERTYGESGTPVRNGSAVRDFSENARSLLSTAVLTLRLVGHDRFMAHNSVVLHPPGGVAWSPSASPQAAHGPGENVEDPDGALAHLFESVRGAQVRGLKTAMRRFVSAHSRQDPEDGVLDNWIGLEAIFGNESSELTLRLSTNVANTVRVPGLSRAEVRTWVKRSYAVRSAVAHGGEPDLSKIKRLDHSSVKSLPQHAADLRWLLGAAIRTILINGVPDFDALMLRPEAADQPEYRPRYPAAWLSQSGTGR